MLVDACPVNGLRIVPLSKVALPVRVSSTCAVLPSEKASLVNTRDFWAPPPPTAKPYNKQSMHCSHGWLVLIAHGVLALGWVLSSPSSRSTSRPLRRSTAVCLRLL